MRDDVLDESDMATDHEMLYTAIAIEVARRQQVVIQPTGFCLNCADPVGCITAGAT